MKMKIKKLLWAILRPGPEWTNLNVFRFILLMIAVLALLSALLTSCKMHGGCGDSRFMVGYGPGGWDKKHGHAKEN